MLEHNNYLIWRSDDKPRTCESRRDMRSSRLRMYFVNAVLMKKKLLMMRADALAHALYSRDTISFWKDVSTKIPLATKVGDAVGTSDINAMGQTHFFKLLNNVHAY